ncbi:MAG: RNA-binding transcriptional accessory protein [Verrucomicrobiaceae bacterium]|nr:MAG: RNA-binding transcriptional accessory protein [Verrucomicrobiaceae bacterium]
MNPEYFARVAAELKIRPAQVAATAELLSEGGTVPFIARYRKEATEELDEVAITGIRDRLIQLAELDSRRSAILKSLEERKLLTDALKTALAKADTMARLEDIFAPYRPKRRTRATIAKEKGLEPLAEWLIAAQTDPGANPAAEAKKFIKTEGVDTELQVKTLEEALAGARDILSERMSDDAAVRSSVRKIYEEDSALGSKVLLGKETDEAAAKYRDYFDWSESLKAVPSHRLLAMRRGEKEGFLMLRVTIPEDKGIDAAKRLFVSGHGPAAEQISQAVSDGCRRLLFPGMETELRLSSKKKADLESSRVFAENLRELLLAAPLGEKRMLAIDPGFRTGCKTVVLDAQGKLLHNDVIYPTAGSQSQLVEAARTVLTLIEKFKIEAIAIGNGTASRETEAFVRKLKLPPAISVVMVNESGASIYSASDAAREEFPDQDITVRGAVSIGRRLMDPLAELVKIDPKSIGVGQYQHDVDQHLLKNTLDDCVQSCVNGVGVELNTASKQLLSYVSGLNSGIAENIVSFRHANGPFQTRAELKKVPRLGDKAFEQAAGFLRIHGAKHPLDSSAVHPERYALVEKMAADAGCTVADLMRDAKKRESIQLQKYVSPEVGLPTLQDILAELAKPGRDPRQKFETFAFADGVEKPTDLQVGMKLPGIVTNVAAFGAFIDIGVHQDGLAHVSQLADHFIKDASEAVKVGQRVQATVLEVDLPRNRISLSLKSKPDFEKKPGAKPGGPGGPGSGGGGGGQQRGPGGPGPQGGRGGNSGGGGRPSQGGVGSGLGNPFGGDWFSQAQKKK